VLARVGPMNRELDGGPASPCDVALFSLRDKVAAYCKVEEPSACYGLCKIITMSSETNSSHLVPVA